MLNQMMQIYHQERVSGISRHWKIAKKNGNMEAIHDLRVEIKRLKAFLELMQALRLALDFKELFSPVRRLFKMAAPVRDPQVLQNIARTFIDTEGSQQNISEYINLLKKKEMEGVTRFIKEASRFDPCLLDKNHRLITLRLNCLEEPRLAFLAKNHLGALFTAIAKYRQNGDMEEEQSLHDIRILCKKTRYTLEVIKSCYSQVEFDMCDRALKELHQALGLWHDRDIAIQCMKVVLQTPNVRPFFMESSYTDFSRWLHEQKAAYHELFLARFKEWNLLFKL
jgi:CHAD domain-containing protein